VLRFKVDINPLEAVPPHVLPARLQTVDQGEPMSTNTVAGEMGHGGEAMVRTVYGYLGHVRHQAEAMEYRVEQHAAKLGARLEALRGVSLDTTIGTTA
jgi:hypothetical protein